MGSSTALDLPALMERRMSTSSSSGVSSILLREIMLFEGRLRIGGDGEEGIGSGGGVSEMLRTRESMNNIGAGVELTRVRSKREVSTSTGTEGGEERV